jgi:hypothetical protein
LQELARLVVAVDAVGQDSRGQVGALAGLDGLAGEVHILQRADRGGEMLEAWDIVQPVGGGDDLPAALYAVGEAELLGVSVGHEDREAVAVAVGYVEGEIGVGEGRCASVRILERCECGGGDLFGPAPRVVRFFDRFSG